MLHAHSNMMDGAGEPRPLVSRIDPETFTRFMPSRPLVTSEPLGWSGVTLQRYSWDRCAFEVPPANGPRFGMNLGGPMQVRAQFRGDHGATRWLGPGQVNFVPAGQGVDWDFRGRPELVLVHVGPELLQTVASEVYGADLDQVAVLPRLANADETASLLTRQLLKEVEAHDAGTRLFATSIAQALCLHLLRRYSSLGPPHAALQAQLPDGRIGRVIEFIRANLAEDLSVDQLASVAGVSASQFGRVFTAQTGHTPYRFLIKARVEAACGMLEHTGLPVIEVALRCGFGQPGHFATTFRRVVGMTPREYRQARRD